MATTATTPRKRNDAYTGILAVSFLAMVGGCVLLYLDLQQYKDGDNFKKAPEPIKIDVPGTQLKVVPGSGTPPPPKKEPDPMPMPDPMMPPGGARNDPKRDSTPVVLPPLEAADVALPNTSFPDSVVIPPVIRPVQATVPARPTQGPVLRIPDPDLAPPPAPIELPVVVPNPIPDGPMLKIDLPPLPSEKRTVAPVTEPSLTDEPPVAPKRFQPPM